VKRVVDRLVEELHDRHEATYDMMRRLDRNGDGRLDIITGNSGFQSPRPAVMINNGAGVFTEKPNAITGPK
jgi:hypothetical protein